MKAYIEVYQDGCVIKICQDDDTVIDRYEIDNNKIHLEMDRNSIMPVPVRDSVYIENPTSQLN